MKHPYVRLAGAILVLCALLIGYYQMIVSQIHSRYVASLAASSASKLDSIIETAQSIERERMDSINAFSDRMIATAKLEAALPRRSEAYGKRAVPEGGTVVRVRDGRVIYPVGSAVRFGDYDDLFEDSARTFFGSVRDVDGGESRPAILCAAPSGMTNTICAGWTEAT